MPLWTKDSPPKWATNAVATHRGWEDPTTGEIYVAIRGLNLKAGAAEVLSVAFGAASYAQGANLSAKVKFSEKIDVPAGASLVIAHTRSAGNVTLYAAAQTGVAEAVFNKKVDNTTAETVPANVKATGTITNDGSNVTDGDTVTIGAKTYTFQGTLTNVDGNVKIGASNTASMTNLFHAINASGGTVGTDYATLTTSHTTVDATNPTGTTVVVTAKTGGTGGNSIASTKVSTHLSWGGSTLAGGETHTGTMSVGAQTVGGAIVDTASAIAATGTLTMTANAANTETVTLDGKAYTFQSTLTNVDGNVKVGATVGESIANLVNAIILGPGAGVAYAAATTGHSTVTAKQLTTLTMSVTAKTAGTAGNSLASTETLGAGAFGGATLAGGVAAVAATKTISAGQATAAGTRVVA